MVPIFNTAQITETGRKGGGRCTGGGRRGGGKRDSQGSGKREKKGKITQHCAIFRNRKNAKRREPTNTGREPGLKGTGSGRFKKLQNFKCRTLARTPPPPLGLNIDTCIICATYCILLPALSTPMFHRNEVGIVPRFPSNISSGLSTTFQVAGKNF